MQLVSFLNQVFKKGGFILTDANSKDYIIGEPGKNPIKLKILDKKLHNWDWVKFFSRNHQPNESSNIFRF